MLDRQKLASLIRFWQPRSSLPAVSPHRDELAVREEAPLTMPEILAERGIYPREKVFEEGVVRYYLASEVVTERVQSL